MSAGNDDFTQDDEDRELYCVSNLPYWLTENNTWSERIKHIRGIISGEVTSYSVAAANDLICINMLTDCLDGTINNWDYISRLFARSSSGTVFLLAKKENDNELGLIWKEVELPELMKNEKVDMIVQLDLKDPRKITAVTIKGGIENVKKYGFRLPGDVELPECNSKLKGNFKLKFKKDGISYVSVSNKKDEEGMETGSETILKRKQKVTANAEGEPKQMVGFTK